MLWLMRIFGVLFWLFLGLAVLNGYNAQQYSSTTYTQAWEPGGVCTQQPSDPQEAFSLACNVVNTVNNNYEHNITLFGSLCGICGLAYIVMKIAKPRQATYTPGEMLTHEEPTERLTATHQHQAPAKYTRQIDNFHRRHPV